eukprot:2445921-Amphidinium_carterae.1
MDARLPNVVERLVKLARASEAVTNNELKVLPGLVRVCVDTLINRALRMLGAYPSAAVHLEFSCDCTPLRIRHSQKLEHRGKNIVQCKVWGGVLCLACDVVDFVTKRQAVAEHSVLGAYVTSQGQDHAFTVRVYAVVSRVVHGFPVRQTSH